jgi:hypothetical protein
MANKHKKVWKIVFHKPLFKKQTHPKNLLMKKNREKLEPNSYINISTIEVYMELYVWVLIRPHFKFFSQKIIIGLTSLNRSMSALNRWIIGLTRWIGCLYIYIYITMLFCLVSGHWDWMVLSPESPPSLTILLKNNEALEDFFMKSEPQWLLSYTLKRKRKNRKENLKCT